MVRLTATRATANLIEREPFGIPILLAFGSEDGLAYCDHRYRSGSSRNRGVAGSAAGVVAYDADIRRRKSEDKMKKKKKKKKKKKQKKKEQKQKMNSKGRKRRQRGGSDEDVDNCDDFDDDEDFDDDGNNDESDVESNDGESTGWTSDDGEASDQSRDPQAVLAALADSNQELDTLMLHGAGHDLLREQAALPTLARKIKSWVLRHHDDYVRGALEGGM